MSIIEKGLENIRKNIIEYLEPDETLHEFIMGTTEPHILIRYTAFNGLQEKDYYSCVTNKRVILFPLSKWTGKPTGKLVDISSDITNVRYVKGFALSIEDKVIIETHEGDINLKTSKRVRKWVLDFVDSLSPFYT